ncbi:MAG: MMPL family transporter [Acidimicrobiales bacterium]
MHDTVPSTSWLHRLGAASGRHPARVLVVWLIALIAVFSASRLFKATYSDSVSLSGTQASTGAALLVTHDPAMAGSTGLVVLHSRTGRLSQDRHVVDQVIANLAGLAHVVHVTNPLVANSTTLSRSGTIGYAVLNFDVTPKSLGPSYPGALYRASAPATRAGLQVEFGGGLDQVTRPKVTDLRSELVGLIVAFIVLALTFGSVLASVLPLLSALISVLIGLSVLGLVALVITFGTASPTLAAMIGLGVGIDYAVFLTTRFRQLMMDGADPVDAAGFVTASSGRAILVAASTVAIAMLGLYGSGMTFIGQLGLAAVFSILTAALGAVTLVPAGLALAGRRIDRWALRAPVAESGSSSDGWHHYAAAIGRHPWRYLVLGVGALAVIAIPVLSLQFGHVDDSADPTSFTDRRAYDLIAQGFGPGANGPLTVVVAGGLSASSTLATTLERDLTTSADVAWVSPFVPSPDGRLLVATVVPASDPQLAVTSALFTRLYQTTLPQALAGTPYRAYVTGPTASQLQFNGVVRSRTPLIVGIVIVLAFLLIMTAFRSLVLALEAAALNLLSIGAAYGVVVAVFQWGWGRSVIGVNENIPIESYVPMMMFAIVFGLSMDYEVFLLSRVKEFWETSHDNHESVARGLASTGRVISAAAMIMISVFLSFVTSNLVVVKQLAVGLSAAVLIDATVVRLLLVPSTMYLFGRRNWWLPGWLDRILPHLDIEGEVEASRSVE